MLKWNGRENKNPAMEACLLHSWQVQGMNACTLLYPLRLSQWTFGWIKLWKNRVFNFVQYSQIRWPRTVTAKPKTSRQNQILHSKNKIALVLPWVFAFAVRYLVFAVKYLVLPWGFCFLRFSVLPREVFCFCREVFSFAVRYFVFAVSFLVLPWQLWATVVKPS